MTISWCTYAPWITKTSSSAFRHYSNHRLPYKENKLRTNCDKLLIEQIANIYNEWQTNGVFSHEMSHQPCQVVSGHGNCFGKLCARSHYLMWEAFVKPPRLPLMNADVAAYLAKGRNSCHIAKLFPRTSWMWSWPGLELCGYIHKPGHQSKQKQTPWQLIVVLLHWQQHAHMALWAVTAYV